MEADARLLSERARLSPRPDDPTWIRYQYADDERLRVRIRTHELYGENKLPLHPWVIGHLGARPGDRILDVGSGTGEDYHPLLPHARLVAVDLSPGMLAKVTVARAVADAQALPFPDALFDRVMANHMLYHVPDEPRALREMRRVVKRGGRVVISTNDAHSMRRLHQLHDDARTELGLEMAGLGTHRFNLGDVDLIRSVFPTARVERYVNALVFRESEPALEYLASGPIAGDPPEVRPRLFTALRERIDAIIVREGVFRVTTDAGCFVADV